MPSVQPLFRNSVQIQGRKLVGMITLLIQLMDKTPEELYMRLTILAKMHSSIGVLANQYSTMMETVLWTLKLVLGDAFDTYTKVAWIKCISIILEVLVPVHITEEKKQRRFAAKVETCSDPPNDNGQNNNSDDDVIATLTY